MRSVSLALWYGAGTMCPRGGQRSEDKWGAILMALTEAPQAPMRIVVPLIGLILLCACDMAAGSPVRELPDTSGEEVIVPEGLPAFRGAQGHGAITAGGRGGRVIAVNTLADSGPGSLRACVEAEGPRVCIFRVEGTIRFTGRPPIIRNPYITIAGQTAPGGGITLAHSGGENGRTPLVVKGTHDVIVRHLRVRNDRTGIEQGSEDSITIESSYRVIIDHLSASWARDEIVNGYSDNDLVTISNSIFSWGIPKHDKCALLAADAREPQRFSFIGNLCAHNGDRNPDINFPPRSCVEIVNNVFYNAESEFAEIWESHGGTPVAIIGNSFIAGPDTSSSAKGIVRQRIESSGAARAYLRGNRFDGKFIHIDPSVSAIMENSPPCPLTLEPTDAETAYERVLKIAGAFPRDALDLRVVDEVRLRSGRLAKVPGQIPAAAKGVPYEDADEDGMEDLWEEESGADPTRHDPWEDADGNGVANLQQFLDDLSDRLIAAR